MQGISNLAGYKNSHWENVNGGPLSFISVGQQQFKQH